jgi:hypothetical protein
MTGIGIILRFFAENSINGLKGSWSKNGRDNLKIIWKENRFLGLLLSIEGICGNLGLLGFIIGIPLYFIFHI